MVYCGMLGVIFIENPEDTFTGCTNENRRQFHPGTAFRRQSNEVRWVEPKLSRECNLDLSTWDLRALRGCQAQPFLLTCWERQYERAGLHSLAPLRATAARHHRERGRLTPEREREREREHIHPSGSIG